MLLKQVVTNQHEQDIQSFIIVDYNVVIDHRRISTFIRYRTFCQYFIFIKLALYDQGKVNASGADADIVITLVRMLPHWILQKTLY